MTLISFRQLWTSSITLQALQSSQSIKHKSIHETYLNLVLRKVLRLCGHAGSMSAGENENEKSSWNGEMTQNSSIDSGQFDQ